MSFVPNSGGKGPRARNETPHTVASTVRAKFFWCHMSAHDEMVAGYLAGRASAASELPKCHKNKSASWKHGWISGRNDRCPDLAERFDVRQRRAEMILGHA